MLQLILSHRNIDFDGLAAMVAAKKLFPKGKMVLSGKAGPAVAEFLSLYKDSLPILFAHQVEKQQLDRVVIVDTNTPERLGEMEWALDSAREVLVYDHHPSQKDGIKAYRLKQEQMGAVTTLLVEELATQGQSISAFEATIFALGIYQDTGAMTHPGTTPRDVRAVALLLDKGANLSVVSRFMEQHLDEAQQGLLNSMLSNITEVSINGILILVSKVKVEDYIGGLAYLTAKLLEITGVNSFISLVKMGKRVHLVGRTSLDCVPMHTIMAGFGGGGHPKAAAATVKNGDPATINQQLIELLQQNVRPLVTAAGIMSYPVKVLAPDTTIKEAGRMMLRYGHSGLPIREDAKLVGMVSRRDVDKALHHGLGHAPVKGFMSRQVKVISPDTPLPEIQRLMVRYDVGRLPVMAGEKIVGIISRSDILRTMHGDGYAHPFNTLYQDRCDWQTMPDILDLLGEQLEGEQLKLLAGIGRLADENNWGAYLVGGFVRDLLLGVPNLDLDIVVVGSAPKLAEKLSAEFGGNVRVHEKFNTATVHLPSDIKVDFATARKEFYEYPAALPTIEETNLREDLYRRDFTVNALAICLNRDEFGLLIDFFCGYSDLEEQRIRLLHNLSFIEDPTRILRAVRFEQRYQFQLEPQTAHVLSNAVAEEALKNISPDRVWNELKLIFAENDPVKSLRRLAELGIWPQIIPGLEWKNSIQESLNKVIPVITAVADITGVSLERWLVFLTVILRETDETSAVAWLDQLSITKEQRSSLKRCLEEDSAAMLQDLETPGPGELHKLLKDCSPLGMALILLFIKGQVEQNVYQYFRLRTRLPQLLKMDGKVLGKMGIEPGPVYGKVLFALEAAVLEGKVETVQDQQRFVRNWLESKGVL